MTPDSAAHYTKRIMDLHLRELQSVIPPTPRQIGGWLLATTEERAEMILQALESSGVWRSPSAFRRMFRCPMDAQLMRQTWEDGEVFDGGEWVAMSEYVGRGMPETPRPKRPVSRDAKMAGAVAGLAEQKTMRRK